ncbi:MAG: formimidoylglutamate deiminase [Burkholderiaceae bacterium]
MTEPSPGAFLWTARAWVGGRWRSGVVLRSDADGCWSEVTAGVPRAPEGAIALDGPVLPSLVNAHSHAFQRAFAGLAERREADQDTDDFWSWRDRMYGVALRITAAQLRAIAAQLFVELLQGGYTQVCEFHYLQHEPDGRACDDPAALSLALADAADDAGIGLTVLPVLYERAGFSEPGLRSEQRRFATTPASVLELYRSLSAAHGKRLNAGIAIHSLRAASIEAIRDLLRRVGTQDMPLHIHVAEQWREVQDCLAATGLRPIDWLSRHAGLDSRWQLVHATHASTPEIESVARSGAGIVICPSTEANLGDGLPDLPGWLQAGVPIALGSDSQVTRNWAQELRWLEYGQRLALRRRNVGAAPERGEPSTAARLFELALRSGARAAGHARWGLEVGARADALMLDLQTPGLLGIASEQTLDALIFATDAAAIDMVFTAGQAVVVDGCHVGAPNIARRFEAAMAELWGPS